MSDKHYIGHWNNTASIIIDFIFNLCVKLIPCSCWSWEQCWIIWPSCCCRRCCWCCGCCWRKWWSKIKILKSCSPQTDEDKVIIYLTLLSIQVLKISKFYLSFEVKRLWICLISVSVSYVCELVLVLFV